MLAVIKSGLKRGFGFRVTSSPSAFNGPLVPMTMMQHDLGTPQRWLGPPRSRNPDIHPACMLSHDLPKVQEGMTTSIF